MFIQDQYSRPLRDLRISLIDRCNFRCPYCMPSEQFHHAYEFLNKNQWLSFEEIVRLAKVFIQLGVKKIRLTGGEPLMRPDIDKLIKELVTLDGLDDLALTTNGSMLTDVAPKLKAAGLKRLTISLDSLDPVIYKQMSGNRGEIKDVLDGIKAAQYAGFNNIKINTVIQRGVNDASILDLVKFARDNNHSIRFIEYMDVGNQNQWNVSQVVSAHEMITKVQAQYPLEVVGGTEEGDTSLRYRFTDGKGEIGFIASVTKAFCGTCNRLRLSADGKLYTCLFAVNGTDLKSSLRNYNDDACLAQLIKVVWQKREDRYSEQRAQIRQDSPKRPKVEMYHIGG